MNLQDLQVANKKVILRADLDVDNPNENDVRLKTVSETVKYLSGRDAKVIIIGHRGRPSGKVDLQFSLKPICEVLSKILGRDIDFVNDVGGPESTNMASKIQRSQITMLENLRFDSGEELNGVEFVKKLASLGEMYVNEAFASSHRQHASIVGLPHYMTTVYGQQTTAIGLRFQKEIENLSKVFDNPRRPLVFLISGLKEDKLNYVKGFESLADKILVGGRLPELMGDKSLESVRIQTGKVVCGNLNMDKEDITLNTIEVFEKEIAKAGTIVVSGPLGKFEDEGHRQGTDKIFKAVVSNSSAFKVAGGGDTEDAIRLFNLQDKFDWVSVGGGAMLEFLSKHTLPGIEVVKN